MSAQAKIFRVFISSTFSDFADERAILHERVFPSLAASCAKTGSSFQAIDMRWGISADAASMNRTLDICLSEVQRCVELSPRPSFIALIGQRYGWRPLPSQIDAQTQAVLMQRLREPALFEHFYRLDENAVPPHFVLLPASQANGPRHIADETRLREMLRDAALEAMPEAATLFTRSATELEIRSYFEQPLRDASHAFAYVRSIANLADAPVGLAARFTDVTSDGRPDAEAASAVEALIGTVRRELVHDVREFATVIDGEGVSNDYLEAFARRVEDDLRNAISEETARIAATDAAAAEQAAQARFLQARMKNFLGREAQTGWLLDRLRPPPPKGEAGATILVHGPTGVGKTAFLARAVARLQEAGANVFYRFIGATPESTDRRSLLTSLAAQLRGAGHDASIDDLATILKAIPADQPAIIVLDGLDQLQEIENFAWLPSATPAHVQLVASIADGPLHDALQPLIAASRTLDLGGLQGAEAEALVELLLAGTGRRLTTEQAELVGARVRSCPLPLYAILVAAETMHWRSFDGPKTLAADETELVSNFLARLVHGPDHGELLARKVLGMIALSSRGMSERELQEILSDDEAVRAEFWRRNPDSPQTEDLPAIALARLLADLKPYLVERREEDTILLTYFHRLFMEVVRDSIDSSPGERKAVHGQIAAYFDRQPNWRDAAAARRGMPAANLRKSTELWTQLHQAGDAAALAARLKDFDFLMARFSKNEATRVCREFSRFCGGTDADLARMGRFMSHAEGILARGDAAWPAHKILLQLASEQVEGSPLERLSTGWLATGNCGWRWWQRTPKTGTIGASRTRWLHGPNSELAFCHRLAGGQIVAGPKREPDIHVWDADGNPHSRLRGLERAVSGIQALGGRIVGWGGQRWCLWRLDGAPLRNVRMPRLILGARLHPEGFVVWARDGLVRVFDGNGAELRALAAPTSKPFDVHVFPDGGVLAHSAGHPAWFHDAGGERRALPDDLGLVRSALALADGAMLLAGEHQLWLVQGSDADAIGPTCTVLLQADDETALAISENGSVHLWRRDARLRRIGTLENLTSDKPRLATVTPTGDLVLKRDFSVVLWRGPAFASQRSLEGWSLGKLGSGAILVSREDGQLICHRPDGTQHGLPPIPGITDDKFGRHLTEIENGYALLSNHFRPGIAVLDRDGRVANVIQGQHGGTINVWPLGSGVYLIEDKFQSLRLWSFEDMPDEEAQEGRVVASLTLTLGREGFATLGKSDESEAVQLWDRNGRTLRSIPTDRFHHKLGWRTIMQPLSSGALLVWPGGHLTILSPHGDVIADLGRQPGGVERALELSHGGFATMAADSKFVRLWSVAGKRLADYAVKGDSRFADILELADGRLVVANYTALHFFRIDGTLEKIVENPASARIVQIAADRLYLQSGVDVRIIDLAGVEIETFKSIERLDDPRTRKHVDPEFRAQEPAIAAMAGTFEGLRAAPHGKMLEIDEPDEATLRWHAMHPIEGPVASHNRIAFVANEELVVLWPMAGGRCLDDAPRFTAWPAAPPRRRGLGRLIGWLRGQ